MHFEEGNVKASMSVCACISAAVALSFAYACIAEAVALMLALA